MKLRSGKFTSKLHKNDLLPDLNQEITHHNAGSPLLQLPQEIKNIIYAYAMGHETVHITMPLASSKISIGILNPKHLHKGRVTHFTCVSECDTPTAYDHFTTADLKQHPHTVPLLHDNHKKCYERIGSQAARRQSASTCKVNLALLRTCRQVYSEAHLIPLHTNTFSFHCSTILNSFLSSALPPHALTPPLQPQLANVRHIALDIGIHHDDDEIAWADPIARIPRAFPNLRTLDLTIRETYCICWITSVRGDNHNWKLYPALKGLGSAYAALHESDNASSGGDEDAAVHEQAAASKAAPTTIAKPRKGKGLQQCCVMIEDTNFLLFALGAGWWESQPEWRDEYGRFRTSLAEKRAFGRMIEGWITAPEIREEGSGGSAATGLVCEKGFQVR